MLNEELMRAILADRARQRDKMLFLTSLHRDNPMPARRRALRTLLRARTVGARGPADGINRKAPDVVRLAVDPGGQFPE